MLACSKPSQLIRPQFYQLIRQLSQLPLKGITIKLPESERESLSKLTFNNTTPIKSST